MEYIVKSKSGTVTVSAHDPISAVRQVASGGVNEYIVRDCNGVPVDVDLAAENRKGRRHAGGDL
jgi:hypothetical protein